MAHRRLPDGRWIFYYKPPAGSLKREYFGRGLEGEIRALRRDIEFNRKKISLMEKNLRRKESEMERFLSAVGPRIGPEPKEKAGS